MDNALYVVDIDKLYKYDDPEANLDKAPQARWSMTTFRPTCRTGGNTRCPTARGGSSSPWACPATSAAADQHGAVSPGQSANGTAELVALGVRNSVGGAVDPRTGDLWFSENARDWMSDDMPSDKLNHVTRLGEHFGYPYCHQGDRRIRSSPWTPKVLRVHASRGQARPARRAARHEVLYRQPVSCRVQERHFHRRTRLMEPPRARSATASSSSRSIRTERIRRRRCLPAVAGSTARRSSAVLPTSWRRPTAPLLVADDQAGRDLPDQLLSK